MATTPAPQVEQTKALQDLFGLSQIMTHIDALHGQLDNLNAAFKDFNAALTSEEATTKAAEIFASGIKKVLSDEDYFKLVVAVLGDSLHGFIIKAIVDPTFQKQVNATATSVLTSEPVKGAAAEAVYQSFKRVAVDADVQKAIATTSDSVVKSQAVTNRMAEFNASLAKLLREFLLGDDFKGVSEAIVAKGVAQLQEVLHVSVMEAAQDLRKIKVRLTLDSAEEAKKE